MQHLLSNHNITNSKDYMVGNEFIYKLELQSYVLAVP